MLNSISKSCTTPPANFWIDTAVSLSSVRATIFLEVGNGMTEFPEVFDLGHIVPLFD
jgi:hypothetical protein